MDPFADLSAIYEALIDWPKRLAHEEPFYRRIFGRVGVSRVVDVACGTGHHAAMFASWGLEVEGADISAAMLQRARARWGSALHWVQRGYDQAISPPFDAAICVGNSLALAPDQAIMARALACMLGALRPGGVIVVQVLNVWALPEGPCRWQKAKKATLSEGEVLILKGVHRWGSRGYVELAVAPLAGGLRSESVPFLGLKEQELQAMARDAGAKHCVCYGGYQDQPYEPASSQDLILVAEK